MYVRCNMHIKRRCQRLKSTYSINAWLFASLSFTYNLAAFTSVLFANSLFPHNKKFFGTIIELIRSLKATIDALNACFFPAAPVHVIKILIRDAVSSETCGSPYPGANTLYICKKSEETITGMNS